MPDLGDYIGIPFVWGGRTREGGLDCWGLVRLVQREVYGRDLPTHPHAERSMETFAVHHGSQNELIRAVNPTEVPRREAQEGDIVLMRDMASRGAVGRHVGTAAGPGAREVLHTMKDTTSRIERVVGNRTAWEILKIYRLGAAA